MKNEHKYIKTIFWDISIEDAKSKLPGYTHIKAPSSKYTEDIKKLLKILEYNSDFHNEIKEFRESRGFQKQELLEVEMRDRYKINQQIIGVPPSKGLHEYSVSLCKRYLKNQLPLSFATYIVFNFFPTESTLSKVSLLVRDEPNPDHLLIQVDRNIGITELKNELGILLKEEIEKYLKTFPSDPDFDSNHNDTFDLMAQIFDMQNIEGMSQKEIAIKVAKDRDMIITEAEVKKKVSRFRKLINKSIKDSRNING